MSAPATDHKSAIRRRCRRRSGVSGSRSAMPPAGSNPRRRICASAPSLRRAPARFTLGTDTTGPPLRSSVRTRLASRRAGPCRRPAPLRWPGSRDRIAPRRYAPNSVGCCQCKARSTCRPSGSTPHRHPVANHLARLRSPRWNRQSRTTVLDAERLRERHAEGAAIGCRPRGVNGECAGQERREPLEQAAVGPGAYHTPISALPPMRHPPGSMPVSTPANVVLPLRLPEGALGHGTEQGTPLAQPAGAKTERGVGRAPCKRKAARGLLPAHAFRGECAGGQAGRHRNGRHESALGKREVAGVRGRGGPRIASDAGPAARRRHRRETPAGGRGEHLPESRTSGRATSVGTPEAAPTAGDPRPLSTSRQSRTRRARPGSRTPRSHGLRATRPDRRRRRRRAAARSREARLPRHRHGARLRPRDRPPARSRRPGP